MNNITVQSGFLQDIATFEPDTLAIKTLWDFYKTKWKNAPSSMPVWILKIQFGEIEEYYIIGLDVLIEKLRTHQIMLSHKPFQILIHRIRKIYLTNSNLHTARIQQLSPEQHLSRYYSEWIVSEPRFSSEGVIRNNACSANLYAKINDLQRGSLCWFSFGKEDIKTATEKKLNWFFDIALPIRSNGGYTRAWIRKVFYLPAEMLYRMVQGNVFNEVANHRPEFFLDPESGTMYADAKGKYGLYFEGGEVMAKEWKEEKYHTKYLCLGEYQV